MDGLTIAEMTAARWSDLEQLFGERGASSGCWCMWWRKPAKEWERDAGATNRAQLRTLVSSGPPPGLLAYRDGRPVGWCAVAPRDDYVRLNRSRKLGPVDDTPVWSVSCFYIGRHERGAGVASALLEAAVDFVRTSGGTMLEGYPIDTNTGARSNADVFTGTLGMFRDCGFREVARRDGRPIVRRKARP